jgi:hypothetical protein
MFTIDSRGMSSLAVITQCAGDSVFLSLLLFVGFLYNKLVNTHFSVIVLRIYVCCDDTCALCTPARFSNTEVEGQNYRWRFIVRAPSLTSSAFPSSRATPWAHWKFVSTVYFQINTTFITKLVFFNKLRAC